ncbi:LacI family DNA-binding transcriptional regulator [Vallitalea guaymasensis]|uniref:LacI family DNA-binding transcriptional regulator n=1 Tax=Vallitalea guaymasensis TaxID=1185412 RepID=UPI00272C0D3F|nr:LacI family DNA-binding transcriptional regulator [Vallitalea guaymasensis]
MEKKNVKEIAKLAGVSTATISRVINNNPNVKESTRQHVLEIVNKYGFKPDRLAKNLRTKKSYTLLVLIPTVENPYFAEIIRGINEKVYNTKYEVIIGTVEHKRNSMEIFLDLLKTNQIDGAIFVSSSIDKSQLINIKDKKNIVLCNEYIEGMDISYVCINNLLASYEATKKLIESGCKNLCYLAGRKKSISSEKRKLGFHKCLDEYDITSSAEHVIYGPNSIESGYESMKKIHDSNIKFDGILVNSDLKAAGVIQYLKQKDFKIGEDVKLICFDGTFVSEIITPKITTINQPGYIIGQKSLELLVNQLEDSECDFQSIIVEHEIKKGETL